MDEDEASPFDKLWWQIVEDLDAEYDRTMREDAWGTEYEDIMRKRESAYDAWEAGVDPLIWKLSYPG